MLSFEWENKSLELYGTGKKERILKKIKIVTEHWEDRYGCSSLATNKNSLKLGLYPLQPKMEKLYTVSRNKTGSWLWLGLWTPYCQIQTEIEESGENH